MDMTKLGRSPIYCSVTESYGSHSWCSCDTRGCRDQQPNRDECRSGKLSPEPMHKESEPRKPEGQGTGRPQGERGSTGGAQTQSQSTNDPNRQEERNLLEEVETQREKARWFQELHQEAEAECLQLRTARDAARAECERLRAEIEAGHAQRAEPERAPSAMKTEPPQFAWAYEPGEGTAVDWQETATYAMALDNARNRALDGRKVWATCNYGKERDFDLHVGTWSSGRRADMDRCVAEYDRHYGREQTAREGMR